MQIYVFKLCCVPLCHTPKQDFFFNTRGHAKLHTFNLTHPLERGWGRGVGWAGSTNYASQEGSAAFWVMDKQTHVLMCNPKAHLDIRECNFLRTCDIWKILKTGINPVLYNFLHTHLAFCVITSHLLNW